MYPSCTPSPVPSPAIPPAAEPTGTLRSEHEASLSLVAQLRDLIEATDNHLMRMQHLANLGEGSIANTQSHRNAPELSGRLLKQIVSALNGRARRSLPATNIASIQQGATTVAKTDLLIPLPDAERRVELFIYVNDVERLANLAAAAHMMLSREISAGKDIGGVPLLVILKDMQDLAAKLHGQCDIVMPTHSTDALDNFYDRVCAADRHLHRLEVLLSVIDERVAEDRDDPVNTLSAMCRGECLPALKRTLFGEAKSSP